MFCDDYLELVKERAYGDDAPARQSAVAAMRTAIHVLLRLFAPVLPFATEEVWSWWQEGSVHRAAWPTVAELPQEGNAELLALTSQALTSIRGTKTDAKVSQKTPLLSVTIAAPEADVELLRAAAGDLAAVGRIQQLHFAADTDALEVRDPVLGEPPQK